MSAAGGLQPLRPEDFGPEVPRRGSRLFAALCGLLLKGLGWRVVGELPQAGRAVVIAAPHTSNVDGVIGLCAFKYMRLDVRFMIKHSLFRGPVGILLRALGAIPVNRQAGNAAYGTKAMFKGDERFWLGITPEGTRTGARQWKTGFYRIATELELPIIVVTLCYRRKEAQVLKIFHPGGERERDLEAIYALFDDVTPRHPERLSEPLKRRRA